MEMIQPLLALMMMSLALGFAPAFPDPWTGPVGVVAYLALGWIVTRRSTEAALQAAKVGQPWRGRNHSVLHLATWGMVLFGSSWLGFVWKITAGIPGLAHVIAFMPYVAHRVVRCLAQWPLEKGDNRRSWSRREYVVFHVRVLMLVVVPILIAQSLLDVLQSAPGLRLFLMSYFALVVPVTAVLVLAMVFTGAPLIVRWVLGARPLEPGPLRTRLEAYGRRTGFKPNDILVWRTGNSITNAMYIGIVPKMRYVVVTDALLSKLDPEQVEAVYAHEAGHGMRRHTVMFLLLAVGLILGAHALINALDRWLGALLAGLDAELAGYVGTAVFGGVYLLLLALFFLVGMGWLSRRFETEADLHAVRTLEDAGPFVRALEAVGLHMGVLKADRGGMRHFGIGTRIGLINRYLCEPDFRASFDRLLRRCRWGVLVVVLLAAMPTVAAAPETLVVGRYNMELGRAREAEDEGDRDRATRLYDAVSVALQKAVAEHPEYAGLRTNEAAALAALADLHLKEGRYARAREVLDTMSQRVSQDDLLGWFNTRNLRVILDAAEGRDDVALARELIDELPQIMSSLRIDWNPSIDQTYTDLFLVLRAAGKKDRPPGRPRAYSPVARLLLDSDQDLLDAAKKDLEENRYRRKLIERAAPDLLNRLR